eukprot:1645371-Prymnesium_polylepis.1
MGRECGSRFSPRRVARGNGGSDPFPVGAGPRGDHVSWRRPPDRTWHPQAACKSASSACCCWHATP